MDNSFGSDHSEDESFNRVLDTGTGEGQSLISTPARPPPSGARTVPGSSQGVPTQDPAVRAMMESLAGGFTGLSSSLANFMKQAVAENKRKRDTE